MNQEQFIEKRDKWLNEVSDGCHNLAKKQSHYPDFYVFQSEIFENPNLLIIAANPAGDKTYNDALKEKEITKRTKEHLGYGDNQYLKNPNWAINKPILEMFSNERLRSTLEKSVIMNAVYFNTKRVSNLKEFGKDGHEMISFCKEKSKELVYEILKPKQVLFIGKDAPKWMNIRFDDNQHVVLKHDGDPVIWKTVHEGIPHYMILHTSLKNKYNTGIFLELKKRYFEDNII